MKHWGTCVCYVSSTKRNKLLNLAALSCTLGFEYNSDIIYSMFHTSDFCNRFLIQTQYGVHEFGDVSQTIKHCLGANDFFGQSVFHILSLGQLQGAL